MTEKEQAVADELRAVLKKHDLAGACFFCDRDAGHYIYEFSPSWSCITMAADGEVRIRALRAEFESQEEQVRVITESTNILFFLQHVAERLVQDCTNLLLKISGKISLSSRMRDFR